ncbi:NUDIX hydrolase [Neorhizobium huautlense]|uniref:NUDIX hydrolase n=1 Tax=Neorhizobium huautlense TaxID=67774 RepID=UPI0027D88B40|nr:NUDIX domain-containing protein [Neorhizobium huautlense]
MITSREAGRWVIPKGNIGRRENSYRAAQRKAFEEACISGKIRKAASGYYEYSKDHNLRLVVITHLLKATDQANEFPEHGERQQIWVSPATAASMVDEEELKEILLRLDERAVFASQDRRSSNREMVRSGKLERAIRPV